MVGAVLPVVARSGGGQGKRARKGARGQKRNRRVQVYIYRRVQVSVGQNHFWADVGRAASSFEAAAASAALTNERTNLIDMFI